MNDNNRVKDKDDWSNLPSSLIKQITSYLNPYLKPELRLINTHWQKFLLPSVIYSTNEIQVTDLDYLTVNYKTLITKLNLGKFDPNAINKQLIQKLQGINLLTLDYFIDLELGLKWLNLITKQFKSLKNIKLLTYNTANKLNFKEFNNNLVKLENLKSLEFSLMDRVLLDTLNTLPLLNLLKLKLELNLDQYDKVKDNIIKMKRLKQLSLTINYPEVDNGSYEVNWISPTDLLSDMNRLDHLTISSIYNDREYYWNDTNSSIELKSELLSLFNSPQFNRLKCFNWDFLLCSSEFLPFIFNNPIDFIGSGLTNLTKLNLVTIDQYLLTLIIDKVPNLIELGFDSPLTIPYQTSENQLQPLKYLKTLKFKGFYKNLRDHANLTQYLFPNLTTLILTDYSEISNLISVNAYFIPLLFPTLNSLIFTSTNYKFYDIDNLGDRIGWKSLYLELNHSNKYILDFIIKKVASINYLYLFSKELDLKAVNLSDKSEDLKIYLCSESKVECTQFNLCIEKELN